MRIVEELKKAYPDAAIELHYKTPLELLVATILSAQCTDERVNKITSTLFKKYKTVADYADASPVAFEKEISSVTFYRQKAKWILNAARIIKDKFGGMVPKTIEEMCTLPGVARKTANVVLGAAYGIPSGVVVDTHVKRLAERMGLSSAKTPEQIELDLMKLVPRKDWVWLGLALILHGRRICVARLPKCPVCPVRKECPFPLSKAF